MKICNVIISNFYKEGYGYQENILPQKQMQNGHDVCIITCHNNGKQAPCEYINDRGVRVVVLSKKQSWLQKIPVLTAGVDKSIGLHESLVKECPDVIFAHGIYAHDHHWIIKYKKEHPNVKLFVDNHADYYNNKGYNSIAGKLTRFLYIKPMLNKLTPLVEKYWGVVPWRVKFLREIFGLPAEKTELLIMGGDENLVDWHNKDSIKREIRTKYKIPEDAFLIVSGGKIDRAKNFDKLIDAVTELQNNNIFLLLFGNLEPDMQYLKKFHNSQVVLTGWLPADDAYSLYLSADLGFFPGTHSVLWEQACLCGLPCVFKDWDGGFNHVDRKGHCILLKDPNKKNISELIIKLYGNDEMFQTMKEKAIAERLFFSYKEIAKHSILS